MLTILSQAAGADCDGLSRRDFLRIGGLGVGSLSLPWLLRQEAAAAAERFLRDKSVLFLFLCGGPSQMETFDPNMTAPQPWCSLTGEVKTRIPGVTFGGTFPKMAALADRLAVVRSYSPHGISDHAMAIRHVFTAGDPLKAGASMGAMSARLTGSSDPQTGVPCYATLIEDELEDEWRQDMDRMRSSSGAGQLGAACAPFDPRGQGQLASDMKLNLPLERLESRRQLLHALDRINRQIDTFGHIAAADRFEQQAIDVILGGAARRALDLSHEDPKVVARYDTSHMTAGYLERRPSTLGRRLLIARRLCEAGCRFVTVGSAGWDNHGNDRHPGVVEGMHLLGTPLDHAVSAFLEDVASRGLSEKILLVITGEFGRTPKIQQQGGRDHWPSLCPLVFAGGGLKMGQVIGRSTRTADQPATEPQRLEHLFGTIMHTLFDVGQLRLQPGVPRELLQLLETSPTIESLM